MKRIFLIGLLAIFSSGIFPPLFAEEAVEPKNNGEPPSVSVEFLPEPPAETDWNSLGENVALLTASPISPLIGAGGFSAYQWWRADEAQRAQLPWYATPWFFVPVLLLAGACIFKDTICASLPPGFKKPFDALETFGNKLAGVLTAVVVVPYSVNSLATLIGNDISSALKTGETAAAAVPFAGGFAALPAITFDFSTLLYPVLFVAAACVFFVVWMASHAINVLILLSPWGGIDMMLKSIRGCFLCLILFTTLANPLLGIAVSLCVIVIAYLVAGWSFRLTVFGTVFCWDLATLRHKRFRPAEIENKVFCGRGIPGGKFRAYGKLRGEEENRRQFFIYRPWLIFPKKICPIGMTEAFFIGRGLFFSTVREGKTTRFILPPRYRGHEEELALCRGFGGGVRDAGVLRAWGAFRELFNGGAVKANP